VSVAADLTELGLREAGERIAEGELSPVELVDSTLRRIEEVDPQLGSYVLVSAEQAMAAARAAEASIAAGYHLGPLHGTTIALKDLVGVRGEVSSAGSKVLQDFVPTEDATIAARLRAAGAIFVGRLNMHEFAYGVTTDNPHYGAARNPWDTGRTPGGSSGGSGAAVAARLCCGAIGTDTGCSIRLPAAFNGIAGIRPTIGRVSNHGITPLAWTLDTAGPMCRTVEDCALMLGAIAGFDAKDRQTAGVPVPNYVDGLDRGLEGMRIALIEDFTLTGLQAGVAGAVEAAIHELEAGGAQVREVAMTDLEPSISALLTVDIAEPAAYHAAWLRERPQDYGDDVRALLEVGELYLATHYIQAQRYRTLLRDQFDDVLRDVDAILTPTVPFTAPPVGATDVTLESGETLDIISAVMRYNALPPLVGLPALSVPCGFADDGLPVGMQLIGRAFDEGTLFRIGHGYQRLTTWHQKAPSL
jgi:aspartyl-tRNA(Asn)/glutamyl-tRNA(Gln) amidotransferase subunit A